MIRYLLLMSPKEYFTKGIAAAALSSTLVTASACTSDSRIRFADCDVYPEAQSFTGVVREGVASKERVLVSQFLLKRQGDGDLRIIERKTGTDSSWVKRLLLSDNFDPIEKSHGAIQFSLGTLIPQGRVVVVRALKHDNYTNLQFIGTCPGTPAVEK